MSNNLSLPATTTVTLPATGIVAETPGSGAAHAFVDQVRVAFNGPVTVTGFSLAGAAGDVAGATQPLTATVDITQDVHIGAVFLPDFGYLPPGPYTATIGAGRHGAGRHGALTPSGAAVGAAWNFQVVSAVTTATLGIDGGTLLSFDGAVAVEAPPGSLGATTTLTLTVARAPQESPGTLVFAGQSFSLEATDAAGNPVTSFAGPITLTLHYSPDDLLSLGIASEASLNLEYWDGSQ